MSTNPFTVGAPLRHSDTKQELKDRSRQANGIGTARTMAPVASGTFFVAARTVRRTPCSKTLEIAWQPKMAATMKRLSRAATDSNANAPTTGYNAAAANPQTDAATAHSAVDSLNPVDLLRCDLKTTKSPTRHTTAKTNRCNRKALALPRRSEDIPPQTAPSICPPRQEIWTTALSHVTWPAVLSCGCHASRIDSCVSTKSDVEVT
mmetsp:Transcript_19269/g.48977  ORF Transcript_19269/g.48977 Transcript_19269/m.48977 type:complete len:206 (+) Transcript_19269:829-1446(+)